jgi:hypothetical protein
MDYGKGSNGSRQQPFDPINLQVKKTDRARLPTFKSEELASCRENIERHRFPYVAAYQAYFQSTQHGRSLDEPHGTRSSYRSCGSVVDCQGTGEAFHFPEAVSAIPASTLDR